jgi:hypothetical protein
VKNVSSTSEAQSLSDGGEAAAELVYVPERFCCGFEITRSLFEPTPRKIASNRANAKRSTGPRTERGKRNAKFNAVTHGLFAKHVAIPICDGYEPEKEFQALLDELHQEFQPVGLYEEWLVVKIGECPKWKTWRPGPVQLQLRRFRPNNWQRFLHRFWFRCCLSGHAGLGCDL